jgi:hypothetical protein
MEEYATIGYDAFNKKETDRNNCSCRVFGMREALQDLSTSRHVFSLCV